MLLNIFDDIKKFFSSFANVWNFIATYWWYFLIGLGVALFVIILWAIIAKGTPNKVISWLLVVLCLAGSVGVALLVDKNKVKPVDPDNWPPTEIASNGAAVIDGNRYMKPLGNYGYTWEQIDEAESKIDCPTHDDMY